MSRRRRYRRDPLKLVEVPGARSRSARDERSYVDVVREQLARADGAGDVARAERLRAEIEKLGGAA